MARRLNRASARIVGSLRPPVEPERPPLGDSPHREPRSPIIRPCARDTTWSWSAAAPPARRGRRRRPTSVTRSWWWIRRRSRAGPRSTRARCPARRCGRPRSTCPATGAGSSTGSRSGWNPEATVPKLIARKDQVALQESLRIRENLRRHGVDLVRGHARFADLHTVAIETDVRRRAGPRGLRADRHRLDPSQPGQLPDRRGRGGLRQRRDPRHRPAPRDARGARRRRHRLRVRVHVRGARRAGDPPRRARSAARLPRPRDRRPLDERDAHLWASRSGSRRAGARSITSRAAGWSQPCRTAGES